MAAQCNMVRALVLEYERRRAAVVFPEATQGD